VAVNAAGSSMPSRLTVEKPVSKRTAWTLTQIGDGVVPVGVVTAVRPSCERARRFDLTPGSRIARVAHSASDAACASGAQESNDQRKPAEPRDTSSHMDNSRKLDCQILKSADYSTP
jgi:hypothetical protein